MRKRKLNIKTLVAEAAKFAGVESTYDEPGLYGVTDGKAVGTYLEHKFTQYLEPTRARLPNYVECLTMEIAIRPCNSRSGYSRRYTPHQIIAKMPRKSREKWEFGDFQTPSSLARQAMSVLGDLGIDPQSIVEPTCGKGSFLIAAARRFATAKRYVGADVNAQYLSELKTNVARLGIEDRTSLMVGDFFSLDWSEILDPMPEPILIVGNPPWVTSSELGLLKSHNVPKKSNFQQHRGYEAKTGKSNFDISESMLLQNLNWLDRRQGTIAVLCKTAVARKVLSYAWKHNARINLAKLFLIDAQEHFGASVDACFLVVKMTDGAPSNDCSVYDSLWRTETSRTIGYRDELILADVGLYQRWQHLKGNDDAYVWRSGIKHDCSKVMEIERCGSRYKNGAGELVALEEEYLYPMLKSSDIGSAEIRYGRKYMLVTQRYVGEETNAIRRIAPRTWQYLQDHDEAFSKRGSSIYRDRPKFSIFGVGPYSFAPWKVAISGFYTNLDFKIVTPCEDKIVVFDDTVYFLPCWSESEARFIANLLNSQPAQGFYRSMIFWTDKRPITVEILKRLNLRALSAELNCEAEYLHFAQLRSASERKATQSQLALWV